MLIIVLLASMLIVTWLVLLFLVNSDDWLVAAYNRLFDNLAEIDKLRAKDSEKAARLAHYHGLFAFVMRLFLSGNASKKIAKLEEHNEHLRNGNFKSLNIMPMPGYVLLRKFDSIGRGEMHKKFLNLNMEMHGRKHAEKKTKHFMASLLSYPICGVSASLLVGATIVGFGAVTEGLAVLGIGTVLVLVLVYAVYDELNDKVNKRRQAIARQFPNVVSKLALLVTSGMTIERAWRETAFSQSQEIYKEMQKTSEEMDNLISPEAAFSGFIDRCNTRETAKLASVIMQSLSRDASEAGRMLKELAKDAWLDRKHCAKREAEKANAKLMIPTMLLFLAILVIIMVPVAMNFSSF